MSFRNIPPEHLQKQISKRIEVPHSFDQNATPLCGPACLTYLMAKYFPKEFEQFVWDLYHNGEAKWKDYLVETPKKLLAIHPEHDQYPQTSYGSKMLEVDYILLTSIRAHENKLLTYNGLYGIGGITPPSELTRWCKQILQMKNIKNNASILGSLRFDAMDYLKKMDDAFQKGNECFICINMYMIESQRNTKPWGKFSDKFLAAIPCPNHWITYNGGLEIKDDKISFQAFSWGDPIRINVDKPTFQDTFYGYVSVNCN